MGAAIEIRTATSPGDVAAVKELFLEYADFLNVDLCFQGFDEEIATFPDAYEVLFLARVDGEAVAAIGLKDLGERICEMKRLYARPQYQGLGLGGRLCDCLIDAARSRGFSAMRLDTLQRLEAAIALYRKRGFVEIEKYYDNPEEGVIYMELAL
ncbi:MAG: GNAT family N-acetyltransferase [Pseudomonadota bacterium]